MSTKKDRRYYRRLKRDIKREGNKRKRLYFKIQLEENPEEAHLFIDFDYKGLSSKTYNGLDDDPTRKRPEPEDNLP